MTVNVAPRLASLCRHSPSAPATWIRFRGEPCRTGGHRQGLTFAWIGCEESRDRVEQPTRVMRPTQRISVNHPWFSNLAILRGATLGR